MHTNCIHYPPNRDILRHHLGWTIKSPQLTARHTSLTATISAGVKPDCVNRDNTLSALNVYVDCLFTAPDTKPVPGSGVGVALLVLFKPYLLEAEFEDSAKLLTNHPSKENVWEDMVTEVSLFKQIDSISLSRGVKERLTRLISLPDGAYLNKGWKGMKHTWSYVGTAEQPGGWVVAGNEDYIKKEENGGLSNILKLRWQHAVSNGTVKAINNERESPHTEQGQQHHGLYIRCLNPECLDSQCSLIQPQTIARFTNDTLLYNRYLENQQLLDHRMVHHARDLHQQLVYKSES